MTCVMLVKHANIYKPYSRASHWRTSQSTSQEVYVGITEDSVEILGSTSKREIHHLTLEAFRIIELKPFLNTQNTMTTRDLKLKIKL